MKSVVFAVAAFAATIGTSASAQTYDAFSSFNGTQGAGNFIYGEADSSQPATSGVLFAANTNCFIQGSTCLQREANGDVPGVTKGGSPAFQYGSVNVPTDRLLAHPGNDTLQTFIAFVAPAARTYLFTATFNIQDTNPTGVGINLIRTTAGGLPLIFTPLGLINGTDPTYSFTRKFFLGSSEAAGFGLDANGNFSNDSTGVQFSVSQVSAVPEPATWALMILGFGLIGGAMRARKPRVSTTFATA